MSIIQKHIKDGLGSLTTITNPTTGKTMFIAKEVASQWGHTNVRQSLSRLIDDKEKLLIKRAEHPHFFKELECNFLLHTKTHSIWMISESALYTLILSSSLKTAQPFKDWVTKEVLPSIRENGKYSLNISQSDLYDQTKLSVQLDNSEQVTGLELHKIKDLFNAKKYKSSKQVLRENKPELAAVMSLNDHLVINNNVVLEQLKEIDKAFAPAFKSLINAGFKITE